MGSFSIIFIYSLKQIFRGRYLRKNLLEHVNHYLSSMKAVCSTTLWDGFYFYLVFKISFKINESNLDNRMGFWYLDVYIYEIDWWIFWKIFYLVLKYNSMIIYHIITIYSWESMLCINLLGKIVTKVVLTLSAFWLMSLATTEYLFWIVSFKNEGKENDARLPVRHPETAKRYSTPFETILLNLGSSPHLRIKRELRALPLKYLRSFLVI